LIIRVSPDAVDGRVSDSASHM